MRRLLSGLAAISLLAQQAHAELDCLQPQERSLVEVAALRSQLMVLATGCRQDDRYNAFVRKYQADLMGNEKAVGDVFKRIYGKRGAAGARPVHHRPRQWRVHPPACGSVPTSASATACCSKR